MDRTPRQEEKHGRQPLWLLEVSHNFRPRRRRLNSSRAGRARRRRNLLERGLAAKARTNFRLPHRRGRGVGTRDARRRQRFQRSHAPHEYGGGSYIASDGVIYFSNNIDQRLYRQDVGRPPSPITPAPAGAAADALRYADGIIDRRRGRMVCVREDHTGAGEAITTLVAVDLSAATATQVLVSGNAFYSTPRLSPDGNRMSWLTWRHPNMPWVATEAWVGDILQDGTIGNSRPVAGGPDESVLQPEWSSDGDLYFVSDGGSGCGIFIASMTARSSPWRRWTPNSGDRNGSSVCRPTHSSLPTA